jgi:eukaryotic-like serine/threonine-protein kinase
VSLEDGTVIGRYRILRRIATGGMAEVYAATQMLTAHIERPVALKLIRPEYSESEDFRGMFLDEARTACTLSHPNIAHIYEVGESADGRLFMAMELVLGETLATVARTLRDQNHRFPAESLYAVGTATLSALEAVHALKVEGGTVNLVHRDVSPHNLLLSANGSLKLIDFGIAKAATNRNLTMPGVTKGKSGYFSPEQAMGKRLDGRSDLFSLGVTLYKLTVGETPFDHHEGPLERNHALVRGEWKPLRDAAPQMDQRFCAIVDRAMAVRPDDRFQTAAEMRESLEQFVFDSNVRTGTSVLSGYVSDDGTVATDRPAALTAPRLPSQSSNSAAVTPPTRRFPNTPVVVLVAPVLIGCAAAIGWWTRSTPARFEPAAPTVANSTKLDNVSPPKTEQALIETSTVVVVDGEPSDEQPLPQTADTSKALAAKGPRKSSELSKVQKNARPKATLSPPPMTNAPPMTMSGVAAPTADAPAGNGKFAIAATNPASVATFLINGQDVGPPPLQLKRVSGQYRVQAKLLDGKKSQVWSGTLSPDAVLRLVYEVETDRWTSR